MDFKTVQIEETKVYGIPVKLTKSQNFNYQIITNHWKEFNYKLKVHRKENSGNWIKFGLTYKKLDSYFYMPAVPWIISNPIFETISIPGGKYLIFQHKGPMKLLKTTTYNIYKEVIPDIDLQIDKERTVLHFEYYDYRFNWNKNDSIIDIYVPLLDIAT